MWVHYFDPHDLRLLPPQELARPFVAKLLTALGQAGVVTSRLQGPALGGDQRADASGEPCVHLRIPGMAARRVQPVERRAGLATGLAQPGQQHPRLDITPVGYQQAL